ncbi:MAG: 4-(cytidine 5'-diphospho)-2-C-methyl-D-erythritol kinase [Nocardiopsaceae bacterium]|nr:4-(cytidine 5'-diphospho)-2-C-methyl-D-erythritol kinase [Nocardiopsaceae bacterium]
MSSVTAVTARVPAKVNLQLTVGPVRPDGYHDLVTVFHAVSLYDEVTVTPAQRDSVTVTGEGAGEVPLDGSNLALRAAAALSEAAAPGKRRARGVAIRIRKRIPVAAGLAGGSANAAAALVACNELWRIGLSQPELAEIAAGLGADVTFALIGGTAVGLGRGEQVTPALVSGSYHWVLAFADGALSTPEVYAAADRLRTARDGRGAGTGGPRKPVDAAHEPDSALLAALRAGDPAAVGRNLSNDLQPAALGLRPGLRRALAAGREFGALGAIVSGSGPTCAYLARDAHHAREIAVALTGTGVCRSVARVLGPAPGAVIVPAGQRSPSRLPGGGTN